MKRIFIVCMFFLFGCSNPSIVKISPDTYILFREDHAGIFGSASSLKAGVIRDASVFAKSQGKVAIPISSNFKPIGNGPAQWASFEYQFRIVDKNDPEFRRTSLIPRADIVIEKKKNSSVDVKSKHKTGKPEDVYTELIKLDELRKKGIITQSEFKSQKKKILSNGSP